MQSPDFELLPPEQQRLVRRAAEVIGADFAGTFGRETVERLVADSLAQLVPTARITTYLPLLTERSHGRVTVWSAGTQPGSELNPAMVEAMDEVGIDISGGFPKPWTDEIVRAADVVVTMGCGDACPIYPGKRYEDWELQSPAGPDLASVRAIRDEIRERVEHLVAALGLVIA